MKKTVLLLLFGIATLSTLWLAGCASEPAPTQKLYTDSKMMWDEVNRAFTLPGRSPERVDLMNKILSEKWDVQIVSNLQQYLKDAPNGKYAKEATDLLEKARQSDKLRMLAQVRPMLEQQGIPKTAAESDSVAARLNRERMQQSGSDTAAKPATTGGQ